MDKKWPLDAENGFLSYKKMVYEQNLRQVRRQETIDIKKDGKIQKKTVYSRIPLCGKGSHVGWFCPKKELRQSDIAEDLGLGITLYFKTIKQLILFFLVCTELSLPSFAFFWTGR